MRDRNYLYHMYNATSTEYPEGSDDIETYEFWLERQLLSRIARIEELESKLSNIGRSKVDSAVTSVNGDYTNVPLRTDHGDGAETAVESAFPSTPQDGNICSTCGLSLSERIRTKTFCHNCIDECPEDICSPDSERAFRE